MISTNELFSCYNMFALVLIALLTWQRAEAMSLLKMHADSSASAEDNEISNFALIPFDMQSKPQEKSSFNYKVSENLPFLDAKVDNSFSNIPDQEFILGTTFPDQPDNVGQTKTNLMNHLSHYLSKYKPDKEHTENIYNRSNKHKLSKTEDLTQTIQSTCSQYMNALGDATSSEKSSVSDATLELITYLCEEFLSPNIEQEPAEVDEDDNYFLAQYERSNTDELRFLNDVLHSDKCDCNKVDFRSDLNDPPVARKRPCHKRRPPVARKGPCHKRGRSVARTYLWPSAEEPPAPETRINRFNDDWDWQFQ